MLPVQYADDRRPLRGSNARHGAVSFATAVEVVLFRRGRGLVDLHV